MTVIHLVRHGHHALLGHTLCGRMPGVGIDARGRRQMADCAAALGNEPLALVETSPQLRARQSAAAIAARCAVALTVHPAVDEIDLGAWTGRTFEALALDSRWHAWNERRGAARPPGGESMAELQHRVVDHLEDLAQRLPDAAVAVVSHAEPIRAAVLHYLGRPLDAYAAIEIAPASITTLHLDRGRAWIDGSGERNCA